MENTSNEYPPEIRVTKAILAEAKADLAYFEALQTAKKYYPSLVEILKKMKMPQKSKLQTITEKLGEAWNLMLELGSEEAQSEKQIEMYQINRADFMFHINSAMRIAATMRLAEVEVDFFGALEDKPELTDEVKESQKEVKMEPVTGPRYVRGLNGSTEVHHYVEGILVDQVTL